MILLSASLRGARSRYPHDKRITQRTPIYVTYF